MKNNRLRYELGTRMPVTDRVPRTAELLREVTAGNTRELQEKILDFKKLPLLNEARINPFISLKHHLLLACSLTENFIEKGTAALRGLVYCVDKERTKKPV